jgi:hypothetical protein
MAADGNGNHHMQLEREREQDTLIEHRKLLFIKLPKRGLLDGNNMQWEYLGWPAVAAV